MKPLRLMEKQKLNESNVPIIDVRGKRTLEYEAVEVARILKNWFGIIATPTKIWTIEIRGASKRKIV